MSISPVRKRSRLFHRGRPSIAGALHKAAISISSRYSNIELSEKTITFLGDEFVENVGLEIVEKNEKEKRNDDREHLIGSFTGQSRAVGCRFLVDGWVADRVNDALSRLEYWSNRYSI